MDDIANNVTPPKCTILQDFADTISKIFPEPGRSVPGAWTQTPISAWLDGVLTVPVLRSDH